MSNFAWERKTNPRPSVVAYAMMRRIFACAALLVASPAAAQHIACEFATATVTSELMPQHVEFFFSASDDRIEVLEHHEKDVSKYKTKTIRKSPIVFIFEVFDGTRTEPIFVVQVSGYTLAATRSVLNAEGVIIDITKGTCLPERIENFDEGAVDVMALRHGGDRAAAKVGAGGRGELTRHRASVCF